ncbi:MAG: hypothetical protein KF888_08415 [Nitrosomonas sp.]|nr:hypothetical protein [Nitrosomonas sp.]
MAGLVEIKNVGEEAVTLSDAVAYGVETGLDGIEREVSRLVLSPGDASDDKKIASGDSHTIYVPFKVIRLATSVTITREDGSTSEGESVKLNWGEIFGTSANFSFLIDSSNSDLLNVSVDYLLDVNRDIASGTTIDFINGTNPLFPGWFVGTSFDFALGEVLDPFTGRASVYEGVLNIRVVPEPSTLLLLLPILLVFLRKSSGNLRTNEC